MKFDPYRGLGSVSRKFDRFVDELQHGFKFETGGFNPRVDISEDDNNLYVHGEFPGLAKEDVKVSVNDDRLLTIKGEKKQEYEETGKTFIRKESTHGSFSRSFILPDNVDVEKINAKYDNGVLELTLPKVEPEKPKEIPIEIQ
jgi:HSP20 family protein